MDHGGDQSDIDATDRRSVLARGFRLVLRFIRMHPWVFAVSMVGATAYSIATVVSTVLLGRVTDEVILPTFDSGRPPTGTIVGLLALVLAIAVIRALGVVGRRYYAAMLNARVQADIRRELADRYVHLPLGWTRKRSAGDLLARADNDTEVGTNALNPLPFAAGVIVLVAVATVALLAVDPLLGVVALAIFPVLGVANRIYSGKIEGPAAEVQHAIGDVSSVAHESFEGSLVVKTLGLADHEQARFDIEVAHLRDRRVRVGYLRAAFDSVMDALPTFGTVVVVVVGAIRVDAGAITTGDVVQVVALFQLLVLPTRILSFFLSSLPPAVVAVERIDEVLVDEVPPPRGGVALPGSGPLELVVSGLVRHHDDGEPAIADVSFVVAAGETVAVVGSTGSGKSTLIHAVAGLTERADGSIRLDGAELDGIDPVDRAAAVSMVFQEAFLFADTLRRNIDPTGIRSEAEIRAAAELARVADTVDELPAGLDTVVGERGVTLSGGQRQRVALARALIRRPGLLLLDDATSAVDPRIETEILAGLDDEVGATVLVVAQRLSTIRLADRVVFLQNGTVEATGTHAELLDHPDYAAIVEAYERAAEAGGAAS